ncbi:hypothetical protein BGZ97_004282 [Linnemannia gamsii]|uniref:Carbonic anhydrase n=1 Tax=Linnemannia gamsii TaxID=64522 RepID=A0A9P6QTE3_9FUNG|nr:hypothetical protein BGZ97_004282 [Linnemannia gamsii]
MDARILPASAFGLQEGDAHVIRNAGGRTPEALRSLVISQQLLGTETIIVAQHTDCGMLTFENKDIHAVIHKNLHGADASHIDFLPFLNLEQNVKDDVAFLRNHELIPKSVDIHGSRFNDVAGIQRSVDYRLTKPNKGLLDHIAASVSLLFGGR